MPKTVTITTAAVIGELTLSAQHLPTSVQVTFVLASVTRLVEKKNNETAIFSKWTCAEEFIRDRFSGVETRKNVR